MTARRVLWVTKGLGLGGTERLVVSTARNLDGARYRLEVAYVLPWKDAFVADLEGAGIRVHCVGTDAPRSAWWPRLRRLVRTGGYDLVHTHSPVPALAVRTLPGRSRPPLVHTEHNVWPRYRWPTRTANALTYSNSDAVIAVSQGVAQSVAAPRWAPWLRLPPVEVLHHGIDPAEVRTGHAARAEARRRLALHGDDLVVGTVANFTPKKDHATLLQAVTALRREHPHLRVVLVGTGPLEAELRERVHAERLDEVVRFTGMRDDVADLLPGLDLFVLSSLHEGLPIAMLEAMAAGVAVVATEVGGVGEVITDGLEGLLVPASDPAALGAAIGKLLVDPGARNRMSASAAQRAEHFGIARAVARVVAHYDEVLA